MTYRVSSAHEEGGDRVFSVSTQRFIEGAPGQVAELELVEVEMVDGRFQPIEGSEHRIPADYVFLAMGFTGVEQDPWVEQFGVALDARGNVVRADDYSTQADGVFVAGDAGRGQSLIVWAIAEGRAAAASVDAFLNQSGTSNLPVPIPASARQLLA